MKESQVCSLRVARAGVAACVALVMLAGCGEGRRGGDDHAHEGEAASAQVTVFGERYEVFVEYRPVVAGRPTRFVTHVTDLRKGEPRREGPMEFELRQGEGAPVVHVEKAPVRPGIYESMLSFPKAGEWGVTLVVPGDEGERIGLPGVSVFEDAHAADHAEVPEVPEGISFLKEQQWRLGTGTEIARKRKLVQQLRLPGKVAARPGGLAQVTPPIAGRLLLPPGMAMPMVGDRVEAGQLLGLIQPTFSEAAARFVEAEGEVVRARLALEQADAALKRIQTLAKAEAKSAREVQEAEFAVKAAQARYDAAMALQGMYRQGSTNAGPQGGAAGQAAVELRSPIGGTITGQSGAAVGEYIPADKALFSVLDPGIVFIEARVPELSVSRLGAGRAAFYEMPGQPGQFTPITGEGLGRLVSLGIQVDAATHTVPLVYEARNADQRLRVGQSINLYVETAHAEEALAIPNKAIVEEAGQAVAFVQVGGETFQKRELVTGIRDGEWVQVVSGIQEGERVVTRGAYAIRLASVSGTIPSHGHAH